MPRDTDGDDHASVTIGVPKSYGYLQKCGG